MLLEQLQWNYDMCVAINLDTLSYCHQIFFYSGSACETETLLSFSNHIESYEINH